MDYCRHLIAQYRRALQGRGLHPVLSDRMSQALAAEKNSVKFCLPLDGRILEDQSLRGLHGLGPLHLPFKKIALEFLASDGRSPKRILFASEEPSSIVLVRSFWSQEQQFWVTAGLVEIPRVDYFDEPAVAIGDLRPAIDREVPTDVFMRDAASDAMTLLGFLNALACSNVEASPIRRPPLARSKPRGLPDDVYHELVIKASARHTAKAIEIGERSSPREHLRRGHVRNLGQGRRVWINSTVVAAKVAGGAVHKTYRVAGRD